MVFIDPNTPTTTQIARSRGLANLMQQQALQPRRIGHFTQGLAQLAQAGAAALLSRKADRQQKERDTAAQSALMALLGGQNPSGVPNPPQGQTASVGGVGPAPMPSMPSGGGASPVPMPSMPGGGGARPVPMPSMPVGGGSAAGQSGGGVAALVGGQGGSGASLAQLLSTAQAFPELAPFLNPAIAARFTPQKGVVVGPGGQLVNPQTGAVIASTPAAPKLKEIADPTSPTGTRLVPVEEAEGAAGPPKSQFRFETVTDPEGNTRTIMVRGTGTGSTGTGEDLSTGTKAKLEQGIAQATTRLDRLRQIRSTLDTRFLELPTQLRTKAISALSRLGVDVSPESRQLLRDFTRFATVTRRNANATLNELSGAAISPAEAKRLEGELPTTSDDPITFMSKMDAINDAIEASILRNQQLLEQGVESLEFNRKGEVTNAPDLDTFMLLNEPQGEIEAGMGGTGGGQGQPELTPEQLQGMSDDEFEELFRSMVRQQGG